MCTKLGAPLSQFRGSANHGAAVNYNNMPPPSENGSILFCFPFAFARLLPSASFLRHRPASPTSSRIPHPHLELHSPPNPTVPSSAGSIHCSGHHCPASLDPLPSEKHARRDGLPRRQPEAASIHSTAATLAPPSSSSPATACVPRPAQSMSAPGSRRWRRGSFTRHKPSSRLLRPLLSWRW